MNNWSTKQTVKQKCLEIWNRGDLIRALLDQDNLMSFDLFEIIGPLKVKLEGPKAQDIRNDFEKVMNFSVKWLAQTELTVETVEYSSRLMGRQRVPSSVVFNSVDEYLAFIGKRHEYRAIRTELMRMPSRFCDFIRKKPQTYLKYRDCFYKIRLIADYLLKNPNPGIYLRELSIQTIDTKFIENHKGVLGEVLDAVLPKSSINPDENHSRGFSRRYGFKDKPERIRFRILDPQLKFPLINCKCPDITLDAASFAALSLDVRYAIVCENEISFLSLPHLRSTVAIFGSGYGFSALKQAVWLKSLKIFYWGDLDTHGLAILSSFREALNPCEVESVFMDYETLTKYKNLCVEEPKPREDIPTGLTQKEGLAYRALLDNKIGRELGLKHVRLEQEFISWDEVETFFLESIGAPDQHINEK
ncbi:MAG: hypothetical protein J6M93_07090 [Succinivibrio sp.]|nr:hypothetical protein [Succinivibrio sp.]